MKRAKIFAVVIYGMLVMGTMTFVHFPELQADEAQAKISAQQARETALRAVPGTVKNDYLETHRGRLVYSVEIAPSGQHGSFEIVPAGQRGYFAGVPLRLSGITEVHVSAMDGSILNVHREDASKNNEVKCAEISSEAEPHRDLL
jgi:hypothetical protein